MAAVDDQQRHQHQRPRRPDVHLAREIRRTHRLVDGYRLPPTESWHYPISSARWRPVTAGHPDRPMIKLADDRPAAEVIEVDSSITLPTNTHEVTRGPRPKWQVRN